ncbi:MAG TPA: hypothetical protein VNU68_22375 [Verrucomicrobiae bacterium]|nr:hypothetical protein [Verrucomicrobiae bacterium]
MRLDAYMPVAYALGLGNGWNVAVSRLVLVAGDTKNDAIFKDRLATEPVRDIVVVMIFADGELYAAPLAAIWRPLAAPVGPCEGIPPNLLGKLAPHAAVSGS